MLFKNNFKIAGCKEDSDAHEATMILWEEYIRPVKDAWNIYYARDIYPKFVFCLVMRNVDFRLGFFIDRKELNRLMNERKYEEIVFMSQHESTAHTNVNIKMYAKKPDGYLHQCLAWATPEGPPHWEEMKHNPYKPKKKKKPKHTTAIVFSSSEIILSGRYEENMKDAYEFFVRTAVENRDRIEEKLIRPTKDLKSHLSGLKVNQPITGRLCDKSVKSRSTRK